jgi:hypothetical protein
MANEIDSDLDAMTREQLVEQVTILRQGIREHRDSSLHALCWHHPGLWGLLPERTDPQPVVPEWPQFLEGCLHYRRSLDEQLPDAPRSSARYQDQPQR